MRHAVTITVATLLASCGGTTTEPPVVTPPDALTYSPCSDDQRVGTFTVQLAEAFTSVQGQVANGVTPSRVPEAVATDGACRLLRPKTRFCDPGCTGQTTCGDDGVCVAQPTNVSVGEVAITGLAAPVAMTASSPVFFYTHRGTLPHPGFAPAAELSLAAAGGDAEAFALAGFGIEALVVTATSVALERGQPARVRWQAAANPGPTKLNLDLNIANHGGTPGRIECDVDDTGSFDIPSALTDRLLDSGYSGFPSIVITRRSADSTAISFGCVELLVTSVVGLEVQIPGLISCSDETDCPNGQQCQADLTCG